MRQDLNQARILELYSADPTSYGDGKQPYYGAEWGDPETDPQWEVPFRWLNQHMRGRCIEIGPGGGRWTQFLSKKCYAVRAFDGTIAARTEVAKKNLKNVQVDVCPDGMFTVQEPYDCALSIDVFVHFREPLMQAYAYSLGMALKPGAMLILSYAHQYPPDTLYCECHKYFHQCDVLDIFKNFELCEWYDIKHGCGQQVLLLRRT